MKRQVCILAIIFLLLLSSSSAFSAIVGLRPVDSDLLNSKGEVEVVPCTFFDIELYIEGLSAIVDAGNGLVGASVNVEWDPLVSFEAFSAGTAWSDVSIDPSPGPKEVPNNIKVSAFKLGGDGISTDNIIGTFELHCLGCGVTELIPGFQTGAGDFALEDFLSIDDQIEFKSLTINQVPIPSAFWLLGSGLVGLIGLGRNRFKR